MAESADRGNLSEGDDVDNDTTAPASLPYLAGVSNMKPRFEAMLKELEENLPSLDNEDSDFEEGSGDEVEIFQRPSNYGHIIVEDADKDLDESLTSSEFNDHYTYRISNSEDTEVVMERDIWNTVDNISESELANRSAAREEEDNSWRPTPVDNNAQSWLYDSNRNTDIQDSADDPAYGRADADQLESLMNGLNFSSTLDRRVAWPNNESDDSASPLSTSPRITSSSITSPHITSSTRSSHLPSRPSRRDRPRPRNRASTDIRLSLGSLDGLDLDIALQNVVEGEYRRHQRSRSSSLDLFELRPGDNVLSSRGNHNQSDPNKCTELMQSLLSLSVKQSGQTIDIDPMSGAERLSKSKETSLSKYEADVVGEKGDGLPVTTSGLRTRSSSGVSTDYPTSTHPRGSTQTSSATGATTATSSATGATAASSETPARDTVYIDLRRSEQLMAEERNRLAIVQRVLKINADKEDQSAASSEASSDEDERDSWFEQRRKIRQALERGEAVPAPIEKFKAKAPTRRLTAPPRRVSTALIHSELVHTAAVETGVDQMSLSSETDLQPPDVQPAPALPEMLDESAQRNLQEKKENEERLRKAKKEAEDLFNAKRFLSEDFDKNRPTMTIDGKKRASPATAKLYHMVSSHEPAPRCLPANLGDQSEIILLTVNLSSNGEILPHRSSTNMDKWDGINSYYILVTWLCSLIPADVEQINPQVDHPFPFNVLGLQQMFISGKLVLAIAVVPTVSGREESKLYCSGSKGGKKGPRQTPFVKFLNKFFSTKSLDDLCLWMDHSLLQSNIQYDDEMFHHRKLAVSTKPMSTFIQIQTNEESIRQYFQSETGFYWTTVDNEEQTFYSDDDSASNIDREADIQNTLVLLHHAIYSKLKALHFIFEQIRSLGLDVSGLRLFCYHTPDGVTDNTGPLLVIGIRGSYARPLWLEELGPMDPKLARAVSPDSIIGRMGGDELGNPQIFTPRNPLIVEEEVGRWFGGRITSLELENVIDGKGHKVKSCSDTLEDSFSRLPKLSPVALLTATTPGDIFLVISPLVLSKSLGVVITIMRKRGFLLRGIRRRRLSQKQVTALGIQAECARYFIADYTNTPSSPRISSNGGTMLGQPIVSYSHLEAPRPAAILLFTKENAIHQAASAIVNIMSYFVTKGYLEEYKQHSDEHLTESHVLHAAPYSDSLLTLLGRDFTKVPDLDSPATTGYISPRLHFNSELEQISVLALVGSHMAHGCYSFVMARLQGSAPTEIYRGNLPHVDEEGLELLGVKWLPALNSAQAKELTPYEVGQQQWRSSVKQLSSEPALIAVFRGVNCAERIKKVMNSKSNNETISLPLDRMVSSTPEYSYRLTSLFFFDRELFAENSMRPLMTYLPPLRSEVKSPTDSWDDDSTPTKVKRPKSGKGAKTPPTTPPQSTKYVEESIFKTMQMGPRPIVTVLVIKPSVMAKGNLAKLTSGLLLENFVIVGMRLVRMTQIEAVCMQTDTIRRDEELHSQDLHHMTSGGSLVLALSRENAVKKLLDMVGPEDPKIARQLDPFHWRGMYGTSLVANGFYASTSYTSAVSDLKHFFPDGVCCKGTVDLNADSISCPAVDSNLSALDRTTREETSLNPGPYNLARLNEVNCIVMLPPLTRLESESRHAKFTDLIQCLQKMEVDILAARMLWLTEEQAQDYLHVIDAGTFSQVPLLCAAPIIVLAVQCSHAVISFNYILEMGMLKINKNKDDYMKFMQTGQDVAAASRMLAFFFHELIGDNCKLQICKKT